MCKRNLVGGIMGKFKRIDTSIDGVYIIEPTVFGDNRGYFMETYSKADFAEIGITFRKKIHKLNLFAVLKERFLMLQLI